MNILKTLLILWFCLLIPFNSFADSKSFDNSSYKLIYKNEFKNFMGNSILTENEKAYEFKNNDFSKYYPNYWIASGIVPGLGQLLMGDIKSFIAFFLLFSSFTFLSISPILWSTFISSNNVDPGSDATPAALVLISPLWIVLGVFTYIASLLDAIDLNEILAIKNANKINLNKNGLITYNILQF